MPENSNPVPYELSLRTRSQISHFEMDVSSKSQIFVVVALKMKVKVNCRGFEQLGEFTASEANFISLTAE